MYRAVTHGIEVVVTPNYLESHSEPENNRFLWSYEITISNNSESTVQLEARYWQITDANGKIEEVRGPGVVGEQPILNPGDSFNYSSGCPLSTPSGIMRGSYQMRDESGLIFDVTIPAFSLDCPDFRRSIN
jgi:ApaG protein